MAVMVKKRVNELREELYSKYMKQNLDTHRSRSVRRLESRNPFANGLLSIFNFVICNNQLELTQYEFYYK